MDPRNETETAPKRQRFTLLGRLGRSRRGSTAVEFALVSIPFFSMLFAIIETALMFFVGQMLDTATSQASRLIRTGQAHQSGMSQTQMAERICQGMVNLIDCDTNLHLDVRTYASFGAVDLGSPLDANGDFNNLQYNIGQTSQIVVVRAFYTWPAFFKVLGSGATLSDGRYVLASVVAFRNEPFPW
jgi:Flp pilus assembly protein TadG